MTKLSAPGHPFQYAWHVPDLDKAIDHWTNVVGVGPFFINEVDSKTMEGFQYRGGDGNLKMRVAWGQSKEGQIELIEVNSTEPNVYHDLIPKDRVGFHHIGIWSDDYFADKSAAYRTVPKRHGHGSQLQHLLLRHVFRQRQHAGTNRKERRYYRACSKGLPKPQRNGTAPNLLELWPN